MIFAAFYLTFLLVTVGYAHVQLTHRLSGSAQLWPARVFLITLGVFFGMVMSTVYVPVEGPGRWLVFLSAFAVTHLPPAAILALKNWRDRTG